LEDGGAAGQRLETAAIAAAAFGTININDHVADLACCMIEAVVKLAVDDQAAADAGAYENSDHILRLALQFGDVHSQHADIGVVFNEDRDVQLLLQIFLQWNILPTVEIRRKNHRP